MKFILTESKYKNILFRYWDKNGGAVDKTFISLFGLDNNSDLTYDQAYKYLIEWRGEKQSKELAKTLLLQNPHHIDCLLYTSPSPRDRQKSRMPSSA